MGKEGTFLLGWMAMTCTSRTPRPSSAPFWLELQDRVAFHLIGPAYWAYGFIEDPGSKKESP